MAKKLKIGWRKAAPKQMPEIIERVNLERVTLDPIIAQAGIVLKNIDRSG